ncbi:MAG: glycosyltransferase family 1 protein [Bacteroidales bacterium]|jgi:glycosyltransferase involved in cell wall biosynthesis
MPSVLIDIYKTNDPYSGLGQFSFHYAKHILRVKPEDYDLHFLGKRDPDISANSDVTFLPANWQKRYLPSLNKRFDLWHSLHQFPSHRPAGNTLHILTIHDLNFLVEKNDKKAAKYLYRLNKNVKRADILTTISDYTKKQLFEHIDIKNKPVHTIYNGVELPVAEHPAKPGYVDTQDFFFTIGIVTMKKNFHTLVPLMHSFPGMKLVIAGNNNTSYARQIIDSLKVHKLENRVILAGKISDEEKYWLYSNCRAFLFPSLAEGFGLPVIEAMLAGKPVFLSKHASLPEIGGRLAYYWDNFEPGHMAKVIKTNLNVFYKDQAARSTELINYAQKYSWKECIRKYLELYRDLLA